MEQAEIIYELDNIWKEYFDKLPIKTGYANPADMPENTKTIIFGINPSNPKKDGVIIKNKPLGEGKYQYHIEKQEYLEMELSFF